MACHAHTVEVANDPLPRPSHPTPSKALRHHHLLPHPAAEKSLQRPHLRIITHPTTVPVGIRKPVPIRHPALVKSAPLYVPMIPPTYPSFSYPCDWQSDHYPPPAVVLHVSTPSHPHKCHAVGNKNDARGHKRRLSDKFRNLFSALHLKKETRIALTQPFPPKVYSEPRTVGNHATQVVTVTSPLPPARPYRSPGTASFLVTRHLPRSDTPDSDRSASTAVSHASRIVFDRKQRLHLVPPGMDISHFSDPSTLESASDETGRSVSSGDILDKSPGDLEERLEIHEKTRLGARSRRAVSLPDIRL